MVGESYDFGNISVNLHCLAFLFSFFSPLERYSPLVQFTTLFLIFVVVTKQPDSVHRTLILDLFNSELVSSDYWEP